MPEYLKDENRDFSEYDRMSTEELKEILRQDALRSEAEEPDTDMLFYVMDLLVKRDKEQGSRLKSAEEAWDIFEKYYMPQSARKAERKPAPPAWLRRITATAAIIALVATLPIAAKAINTTRVWDAVTKWAKETFSFVGTSVKNPDDPDTQYRDQTCELRDLLNSCNHRGDIVPTWVPDGFVFEKVEQDITPVQEVYRASYSKDGSVIRIRVQTHFSEDIQNNEVNDGWREVYSVDGVDYYIFENLEQVQVIWSEDIYECIISGDLTVSEAKQMIDSIKKG